MHDVRAPAVAGTFYPANPQILAHDVDAFIKRGTAVQAIVAPHAGYMYSGPIAGSVFGRVADKKRVLLLGPAHRVYFEGIAGPDAKAMRTPLGDVRVGTVEGVKQSAVAHAQEHSLEVELPFLQRMLPNAEVVPLLCGDVDPEAVAKVLDREWDDDTFVVVSSDLSHFHGYAEACAIDRGTADQVLALDPTLTPEQACGATPLNALLIVAKQRGLKATLEDLRNSGDTAGDKRRVVGYAGFSFS